MTANRPDDHREETDQRDGANTEEGRDEAAWPVALDERWRQDEESASGQHEERSEGSTAEEETPGRAARVADEGATPGPVGDGFVEGQPPVGGAALVEALDAHTRQHPLPARREREDRRSAMPALPLSLECWERSTTRRAGRGLIDSSPAMLGGPREIDAASPGLAAHLCRRKRVHRMARDGQALAGSAVRAGQREHRGPRNGDRRLALRTRVHDKRALARSVHEGRSPLTATENGPQSEYRRAQAAIGRQGDLEAMTARRADAG